MKKFWTLGFFVFLIIRSCIDPITLTVNSDEGVIVVEGGITDKDGPYTVNLFRSVGVYNDLTKRPAVTGAFVYVIDEDGNKERLKDDVPGIFVSDPAFKAQYGKSYYLRIEAFGGKIYESKPQLFQPVDEIDSVYFEFEDKVDTDASGKENNAGFNIYLDATITTNVDYVRWNWTGVYEILTFPEKHMVNAGEAGRIPDPRPCSGYRIINGIVTYVSPCECCSCWVTEYSRSPEVGEVDFYGGKLTKFKIAYVPATKSLFHAKYRIEVEQAGITEDVYDYWKLVKVQKEGGSSLFQPTSAKIRGNLQCINDPSAEIFGLFSVSSVKTKSIEITKDDIPFKLLPIDTLADDCRFAARNSSTIKPANW